MTTRAEQSADAYGRACLELRQALSGTREEWARACGRFDKYMSTQTAQVAWACFQLGLAIQRFVRGETES